MFEKHKFGIQLISQLINHAVSIFKSGLRSKNYCYRSTGPSRLSMTLDDLELSRKVSLKSGNYPGNNFGNGNRWVFSFQSLAECGQRLSRRVIIHCTSYCISIVIDIVLLVFTALRVLHALHLRGAGGCSVYEAKSAEAARDCMHASVFFLFRAR